MCVWLVFSSSQLLDQLPLPAAAREEGGEGERGKGEIGEESIITFPGGYFILRERVKRFFAEGNRRSL